MPKWSVNTQQAISVILSHLSARLPRVSAVVLHSSVCGTELCVSGDGFADKWTQICIVFSLLSLKNILCGLMLQTTSELLIDQLSVDKDTKTAIYVLQTTTYVDHWELQFHRFAIVPFKYANYFYKIQKQSSKRSVWGWCARGQC